MNWFIRYLFWWHSKFTFRKKRVYLHDPSASQIMGLQVYLFLLCCHRYVCRFFSLPYYIPIIIALAFYIIFLEIYPNVIVKKNKSPYIEYKKEKTYTKKRRDRNCLIFFILSIIINIVLLCVTYG